VSDGDRGPLDRSSTVTPDDVEVLALECGHLAPAQAGERRQEHHRSVPGWHAVRQGEDLGHGEDRPLRWLLLVDARDATRILGDDLAFLRRGHQLRSQEPVDLGRDGSDTPPSMSRVRQSRTAVVVSRPRSTFAEMRRDVLAE
jgi:hypothetical protein